jgi:hypothetical protein
MFTDIFIPIKIWTDNRHMVNEPFWLGLKTAAGLSERVAKTKDDLRTAVAGHDYKFMDNALDLNKRE